LANEGGKKGRREEELEKKKRRKGENTPNQPSGEKEGADPSLLHCGHGKKENGTGRRGEEPEQTVGAAGARKKGGGKKKGRI